MKQIHSYICGDWIAPTGDVQTLKDAYSSEPIAEIGHAGLPWEEMCAHARNIGGTKLRAMGFHDRAACLKALAKALSEVKESLYALSSHTGATHRDSLIDIDGGISTLFIYASKGRRELPDGKVYIDGAVEELSRDGTFKGVHIATPLRGVAVQINAFNFPVWGLLEKLAPAWLAGVPVIVKPASQTAYLTEAVVRFIIENDLAPEGALQLVSGTAGQLLDALGPQDIVSFTGSAATADMLRSHAAFTKSGARFIAEQDSLNASLLGPDVCLESEAFKIFMDEIVREITTKAGQKCTAMRRIFVPEPLLAPCIEQLRSRLSAITPEDPRTADAQMGPLVSTDHARDVLEKAQLIGSEAELVVGHLDCQGAAVAPIVFQCKAPDQADIVHTTEAFGPVATVMPYKDLSHAGALINRGGGSLVASMFSDSPAAAAEIAHEIAPWHGRIYFNGKASHKAATGHGAPLPHLIHGGPGRAGGGEELGGIRGVLHYMQRTAIQGHPDMLSAVANIHIAGSSTIEPNGHPFTQPFHDLKIGSCLKTPQRRVTLEDIETFAHFTGDSFYAHMDDEAARANPFFSGRVAHGYLLLSFAAGLFVEPSPGPVLANTGLDNLRFLRPVSPDEEIGVHLTVKSKTRRTDDYGEVRWQVEIFNQDQQTVATYDLLTMNVF